MQPEPTSPVGSDRGVGATLYRAREERAVSVSEVARATGIRPRYLEALENDAPEDDFPGRVYARFFLREYARYLRVPDQPLVDALDARWSDGEPEPEPRLAPVLSLAPMREPRRWAGRLVTVVAAAVLATLVAISALSGGSTTETSPLGQGTPVVRGAQGPSQDGQGSGGVAGPHEPQPPAVDSITARVIASDGRCWVHAVAADGSELYQGTLEMAQVATVHAKRGIELDLGNASVVELVVNGKRIASGRGVTHVSLALRDGRLVVR
ncbi:MAG TPA: helix-turn-helix domain-containing protein [Actinomycetota bacterium]